ncbi:MAG: alkaline phosphatase [Bryobacterales bacterium]|nr:alkaline phosphatase [Bryobacterales bacterium]
MFKRFVYLVLALILLHGAAGAQPEKAKNVILFLADAGGVSTVSAASLHGYGEPQRLFVQSWPNLALSDTSPASDWVSDSAAGMTAIVTGEKTQNGVISMDATTVRNKTDGRVLKTILEYAEERGLSTGVVTDMSIVDATPAACYAHSNNRSKSGEIILQAFKPRFGDGVDVLIGSGRNAVETALKAMEKDWDTVGSGPGRPVFASLDQIQAADARPVAILEGAVDVPAAARIALDRLERNPRGYFLMIEWDAHTDRLPGGLDRLVNFDKLIREIAGRVDLKETLLLFTADHSFSLSVYSGRRSEPLLKGLDEWKEKNAGQKTKFVELPNVRIYNTHTGEEVIATAIGPGAGRVRGFLPNTRLFGIMLEAWGWSPDPPGR